MTKELEAKRKFDPRLDQILTEYHNGRLTADECVAELQKYKYIQDNSELEDGG